MIPYVRHHLTFRDRLAVARVVSSPWLTQGPEVRAFEREFAQKVGTEYAIAVNSGTAALHLAYLALRGDQQRRRAFVPAITFVATANAAIFAGLELGFLDVSPETGRLHEGWHVLPPDGILVPVTLGGSPLTVPSYSGGDVLMDQCHGPYGVYEGVSAACFSFHPAKHIAAGEGGAVATNDPGLAVEVIARRDHGRIDGECVTPGLNYRMPEMAAALARSQLRRLDEGIDRRREIAAQYDKAFAGFCPTVPHLEGSAYHLYQLLVPPHRRDAIRHHLFLAGISTQVHYQAIPRLTAYNEGYGGQWPGAEEFADRTLSIPLFPTMRKKEVRRVIEAVWAALGGGMAS